MDTFLLLLPALEVLILNLISTELCLERRYPRWVIALVLALFTAAIFAAVLAFSDPLLRQGYRGDGRMMLAGFVYLPLLYRLYRVRPAVLFTIMCTCWIYTMGVLSLAFQCAAVWLDSDFGWSLAIETLLFALTIPLFYRYVTPKYAFVLDNLHRFAGSWSRYILLNNSLGFLTLAILHNILTSTPGNVFKLLLLALLLASIFVSNFTLYRVILDAIKIKRLEQAVRSDPLTGAGSRAGLFQQLDRLLAGEEAFSLLFMDLDRFKAVNDRYGHLMGDAYLKHFAAVISRIAGDRGSVYRFGGDEFIVLYQGEIPPEVLDGLRRCRGWDSGAPCPFYQVSTGLLYCAPPHTGDAETTLLRADRMLYQNKREKKPGAPRAQRQQPEQ